MRKGFTLLELVFVIVIMGILSMFGTELLLKTYENYVYSSTLNRLSSQSEMAVKQIANRLQYRIKDSTIARLSPNSTPVIPIGSVGGDVYVLEWIGTDIDGWRGASVPEWSGFIDLNDPATINTSLVSPGSSGTTGAGAMFFIGSDVDIGTQADWSSMMLTANIGNGVVTGNFAGQDVYEFYQFSKSAYGVYFDEGNKELYFYHDYAPWSGGQMSNENRDLIMENVSSFTFIALGDILVIQVCTFSDLDPEGEYAICKEKTVF